MSDRWGSLQRSPRPPSWLQRPLLLGEGKGPTSKGRGREGRGEGRGGEWALLVFGPFRRPCNSDDCCLSNAGFHTSRQPSNSRTILLFHNDLLLQVCIMIKGQDKCLLFSVTIVVNCQIRQVTVQAYRPRSTAGPLTDFNLRRSLDRLALNYGTRTRQAGRTWNQDLRHTTHRQEWTAASALRGRDL